MTQRRRIITLGVFLAVVFLIMILAYPKPTSRNPLNGKCGENLTWQLEDGTLTVSGTGRMDNYLLAKGYIDKLETRHVVGSSTPWDLEVIKKVVIEEGVTSVGTAAFYGHPELISVSLPDSLEYIFPHAFGNCVCLREINLKDTVKIVDESAFYNCLELENNLLIHNS